MTQNKDTHKLWLKTISMALSCLFLVNTCCYGLATLPASHNSMAKREILAALLERTVVRYANSPDEVRLLNANNASCLLLCSGKYLVAKETAQDGIKLLRALVHEDIEAVMQILAREDSYKYQDIKELILKYFPPTKDNLAKYYPLKNYANFSLDLYVNHVAALAFEWLCLVSEGVILRAEIPESYGGLITAIEPVINANRHNYFTEEFWNSNTRGKMIKDALGNGMRFYQASNFGLSADESIGTYEEHLLAANIQPDKTDEIELSALWPLYLFKIDRFFVNAADRQKAYEKVYNAYFRHIQEGKINPNEIKAYIPIAHRPFSSLEEVKEMVGVSCEWSIDFLPPPAKWKGVQLFGFILCLMDDGQLRMSFFDGDGMIKELSTDQEVEAALKEMGLIGGDGMLILIRSSMDQNLKDSAVSGLAGRMAVNGHSHPKGSGVTPSRSGSWDQPADVEMFTLRFFGMPEGFPVDKNTPASARRKQEVLKEENLTKALDQYINTLSDLAVSDAGQKSQMPIDELALYLKVLRAMYEETIGKFRNTKYDDEHIHKFRAEFAGELAYHPGFETMANRMLQESFEGAFRRLAGQNTGSTENLSSLETMTLIVDQILEELSAHPELREAAIGIINDPKMYGLLDEMDSTDPAGDRTNFSVISDRLVTVAKKDGNRSSGALGPEVKDVIRTRAYRLLILADACVNDDLPLAKKALAEYLRLLKLFGNRIKFYCGVILDRRENIMTNQGLRPILMEISENLYGEDDKANMSAKIAEQLIKEGSVQEALDLLEKVKDTPYYAFEHALKRLIDTLFSKNPPKGKPKMVRQLERIIENIPSSGNGDAAERKVKLFVALGNKSPKIGMWGKAVGYYKKAWKAASDAVMKLEYLMPVMRERGIKFSESRKDILAEVKIMAESELRMDYPNENPKKMILLAREYAFGKEYDEAEKCAQFINENMYFPRDHFDHCYGAIIEAAALYGDTEKITYAASKMTNYVKDHFERAAQLLVEKGEYQRAMELGNQAMRRGYVGSSTVGYWGSTQLRIAQNILRLDSGKIEMVREYLSEAIAAGIGSHDLKDMVKLLSEYPALDPDGRFILNIFNTAFERNLSFVTHDAHRIILRNLRKIILSKAENIDPSLLSVRNVYERADRLAENIPQRALPVGIEAPAKPTAGNFAGQDLDPYDTQSTTILWSDLLYAQLYEDRNYEIKYDASRLSRSQIEIIEEYAGLLQKRSSSPDNIKLKPFSSAQGSKESLIAVYCAGKDFKGEGHIDAAISEGELKDYSLRIVGMVNIAFAASNIPDNLTKQDVDKYGPIMSYIKNQYRAILGEELVIPDSPEDILKAIKRIVLNLPKSMCMNTEQIEEFNRLAKESLTTA